MSKVAHKAMKQAGTKVNQLVERLQQWAVEMDLSEDQLPTNNSLKMLAETHGNSLNYIIKHISSPRSAQSAKKNVLLHSHKVAGEREGLLAEREELDREVRSLGLATTQLETDITRLQSDIVIIDGGNKVTRDEGVEVSRKRALLWAHSVRCEEVARVIAELSRRVKQRREMFMVPTRETSYFTRPGDSSIAADGSKSVVLETACKRDLRLICERLVELETLLTSSPDNSDQVEKLRSQVWNKVEVLHSTHSSAHILLSLSEMTEEAAQQLHSNTTRINLKNDAKFLKYHYDQSSGVSDMSLEPTLHHTVQEHLMGLQQAHVGRSVDSERISQSAEAVRQRLGEVRGQVLSLLSQLYQGDSEGVGLARRNFQLELEVAGYKCSLDSLIGVCTELSTARDQQKAMLDTLKQKRSTIEQFTNEAENKQGHIQRLVKVNSAAKTRLQRQQTETALYVHQSICSHESTVVSLGADLVDSVRTELEAFFSLSLTRALTTPGLCTPTCELSISRLHHVQPSGWPGWDELLQYLGLPCYMTSDKILPHLKELLERVSQASTAVEVREASLMTSKSRTTDKDKARGVLASSEQLDSHQLSEHVPMLQLCLSQLSQGLAQCPTLQQTLQDWWYQPSQYATPWVTYEGMSLNKWVEQWRVLTAKLRQLSESQN